MNFQDELARTFIPDRHADLREHFESLPFCARLGLQVLDLRDGDAIVSLPYDQKLVGDLRSGVIHGGAVSALLDTCCGLAVFTHPDAPLNTATIDLRIDYLGSPTPGQAVVARAYCYKITRAVAFVRAEAFDDSKANPIATATAAFTVDRSISS